MLLWLWFISNKSYLITYLLYPSTDCKPVYLGYCILLLFSSQCIIVTVSCYWFQACVSWSLFPVNVFRPCILYTVTMYCFQACVSWVKHDPGLRKQYVYKLLKHVRLPLISRQFLMTHVDSEPLVRENSECKELLLEAMRYHLLPEQRTSLVSYRTTQRQPEGAKPYLFAVGGGSLFAIHAECEVYNPVVDRWTSIANMGVRRSRGGVGALGNMLYVVGGYDGSNDLATGESYNPQANKVRSMYRYDQD